MLLRKYNNTDGQERCPAMNRISIRFIFLLILVTSAFIYGLVVGTYKVFPFKQILYAKLLITGKATAEELALQASERKRFEVYYLDKKSLFEKQATRADIVMIGDSLIDGAEWDELLPGRDIANRGIAGDHVGGILYRMNSIYPLGAKKAFILAGYNDVRMGRPTSDVLEDYKAIVEGLLAHGTTPYIASTILVGNNLTQWNDEIREFNAMLKEYARKTDVQFIDLNKSLVPNDKKLDKNFTRDGIHLNGNAYEMIARAFEPQRRVNHARWRLLKLVFSTVFNCLAATRPSRQASRWRPALTYCGNARR